MCAGLDSELAYRFLVGPKDIMSVQSAEIRPSAVLTCSRFLVMVPDQLNWHQDHPSLHVMSDGLHPSSGFITDRPPSDYIPL